MKLSVFTVADHHPKFGKSIEQLYAELTEIAIEADRLNYDSFFVAEHHFHEYGVVPNPAVFLSLVFDRMLHANILIYDFKNMTVERFEPYGNSSLIEDFIDDI